METTTATPTTTAAPEFPFWVLREVPGNYLHLVVGDTRFAFREQWRLQEGNNRLVYMWEGFETRIAAEQFIRNPQFED